MKKKPIYLWILLILSALLSVMSLFGVLSPVPTAESMNGLERSGVSVILVIVALVFLVRQNVQLANYTYVGYLLVAIIGSIYNFMGVQDALVLFTDPTIRMSAEIGAKGAAVVGIVMNVIFLALVFYKIWRQQKDLLEETEVEEVV